LLALQFVPFVPLRMKAPAERERDELVQDCPAGSDLAMGLSTLMTYGRPQT